ncbi:MAG: ATP-binding protein [Actinomycetota bacterium]
MTTKIVEIVLPASPESVRTARGLVNELQEHLREDTAEDLKILISEVVTNSIRHGGLLADENVGLKILVENRVVRAEITDSGTGFTYVGRFDADTGSGWGLELVERLSSRWGVETNSHTKVWFEIDLAA